MNVHFIQIKLNQFKFQILEVAEVSFLSWYSRCNICIPRDFAAIEDFDIGTGGVLEKIDA